MYLHIIIILEILLLHVYDTELRYYTGHTYSIGTTAPHVTANTLHSVHMPIKVDRLRKILRIIPISC